MRWQYSLPYRPRTFPSPRGLPEVVSFARSRLRLGRRRQIGHSERQRSCRYPQASVLFPGIVPSHARFKLEHPPRPKVVILRIVERRPPGRGLRPAAVGRQSTLASIPGLSRGSGRGSAERWWRPRGRATPHRQPIGRGPPVPRRASWGSSGIAVAGRWQQACRPPESATTGKLNVRI